jgi:putative hydrolase of the HAD superfamily
LTATRAVLLDFYGTLGESEWNEHWLVDLLAARGYTLSAGTGQHVAGEAYDGEEHDEHSVDADAYAAWMHSRWIALLRASGVPDADHDEVLAAITAARAGWQIRLYPEVTGVLAALRDRGLRLVVCSNWDWDLDRHLDATGLTPLLHGRVSSAWVGARKPHPRMFAAAVDVAGVDASEAVFVGDSWTADVEGAVAAGLRPVLVARNWLVHERAASAGVARIHDLRGLLDLV